MTIDTRALRAEARACAAQLRLPLARRDWRGAVGNWAGSGTGSSIEFQDHRPYLPGDDPRHIDWAATSRSGQAIMKLYREEVSPRIDLLVDTSASMALTPDKHAQSLRLYGFCVESALALASSLRVYLISESGIDPVEPGHVPDSDGSDPFSDGGEARIDPGRIPLRPGSLRVCLTDLLFPGEPDRVLRPLIRERGRALLLVPFDRGEEEPDWSGNMELEACETGRVRRQRVTPEVAARYRDAYQRHLGAWRERTRILDVGLARVPAEPALAEALQVEALPMGVVEPWT